MRGIVIYLYVLCTQEDGFDLVTIIKGVGFYRRGKVLDYVSDYLPPTPAEYKKLDESHR